MITIKMVVTKAELAAFIDFPHKLFEGDKNYVPELFIAQRDVLTPGKHPFHNHSTIQPFLAYRDGEIRGRIAAILNNNHNSFSNRTDGFFGFFDLYNDADVAEKLITETKNWLAGKGLNTIIGPVNPTTNDPCGL
ncbi:MAG: hypothetical protein ABI707_19485, partial [Ferruginibacter sp.]